MNKSYSFYDAQTGFFRTKHVSRPASADISKDTPPGYIAIEGSYDHLSQRVDLATGQVVHWQPPQPSKDHEWDAQSKRWVNPENQNRMRALQNIEILELSQLRALREFALGDPAAKRRLEEIDAEIAALRPTATGKPPG